MNGHLNVVMQKSTLRHARLAALFRSSPRTIRVDDSMAALGMAGETGLTPQVVEKDYVLGWLLTAINTHPVLAEFWVFKGGTCLKKCYFEMSTIGTRRGD